ncbi:hypothetical protein QE152_g25098 [Popillia japonica]|uniref:Uncharacterized protein n=1 Tax=Popillia japonica TaxID=7064 RepID=A0AAW1K349_POPJA
MSSEIPEREFPQKKNQENSISSVSQGTLLKKERDGVKAENKKEPDLGAKFPFGNKSSKSKDMACIGESPTRLQSPASMYICICIQEKKEAMMDLQQTKLAPISTFEGLFEVVLQNRQTLETAPNKTMGQNVRS